ncbi:hypothetical protein LJC15_00100 [Desulfovibrio sp. OttesenSCG-928-G11]|nr:hypothetical protein [Desulfovibrio sp. OttesenSCG-928-G11]
MDIAEVDSWLQKHGVHGVITQYKDTLGQIVTEKADQADIAVFLRMQRRILFLEDSLENIDFDLAPTSILDSILTKLNAAKPNLAVILNNPKDNNHRNVVERAVDASFTEFSILLVYRKKGKSTGVLQPTQKQIETFATRISGLQIKLDEKVKKIETSLSALEARSTEASNLAEKTKTDSTNLLAQLQKQFSDSQAQRDTTFNAHFADIQNQSGSKIDAALADFNKKSQAASQSYESKLQQMISDAEAKHARIAELYELVATDGVSGNYHKTAKSEKETADKFRKYGIWIFIAAIFWIAMVLITTFCITPTAFQWFPIVTITVMLVSLGIYFVAQAEKHRQVAQWANQLQLETKAFDPFIASMPIEERTKSKSAMVDKLFGNITPPHEAQKGIKTGHPGEEMLNELLRKIPDAES